MLFDLDGVLFETASLAARARRSVSDERAFRTEYGRLLREAQPLEPDTAVVLQALARGGIALAVVTSSPSAWARVLLNGIGCRSLFGCVVGAEAVRRPKPDPGGLRLALQRLGKLPTEALYVGHEPSDRDAARRAGISFAVAGWAAARVEGGPVLQRMEELLELCAVRRQEPGES